MAATGVLPVNAVADVVADRDAMLRGVAHHTVVNFAEPATQAQQAAEAQQAGETGGPKITKSDGTTPTAAAHAGP